MASSMGRFEHGGDIYSHRGVIDFSANINPLGMPNAVVEALKSNIESYEAYPDTQCRDLRTALAKAEGVKAENIVCTAGATDLLHRICAAIPMKSALVTAPCFSGYEHALEQAGIAIQRYPLREEDGFNVTESLLGFSEGENAPQAIFLCNPNNPTGLTIAQPLLKAIVSEANRADIYVVLDECFLDFTGESTAVSWCEVYPKLIIMRAFTKMYAMAGLRLGYGICSDPDLVKSLSEAGQLWSVSTPAQVAGVAALSTDGWIELTRDYVDNERAYLREGLHSCGLYVLPGKANYLMFRCERPLYRQLIERGFLIRRCENYVGLDSVWYRIAVRTHEENTAFIEALRDVLV